MCRAADRYHFIPQVAVCPGKLVLLLHVVVQALAVVRGEGPSILRKRFSYAGVAVDRDVDGARVRVADVLHVFKCLLCHVFKWHCEGIDLMRVCDIKGVAYSEAS